MAARWQWTVQPPWLSRQEHGWPGAMQPLSRQSSHGLQQVMQGGPVQIRQQAAAAFGPPDHLYKTRLGQLFEDLVRKGLGHQLPLRRLRRSVALPVPQCTQQTDGVVGLPGNQWRLSLPPVLMGIPYHSG